MKRPLTESERTTITCALQVARERYQEDATKLAGLSRGACSAGGAVGFARLEEQFELQAADALALGELIAGAEQIEIEVQP